LEYEGGHKIIGVVKKERKYKERRAGRFWGGDTNPNAWTRQGGPSSFSLSQPHSLASLTMKVFNQYSVKFFQFALRRLCMNMGYTDSSPL